MNLADYLPINAVSIRDDVSSKKRALEEISRLLAQSTEFVAEKDVHASLISREKLGSTGLGKGVAIPHGRVAGLDRPIAAFIKLGQGIDYEANDGEAVDLIFGLLAPQNSSSEHLNILASIADAFRNEEQIEALRSAGDAEALHQLLTKA